jgi:hypothetical protein
LIRAALWDILGLKEDAMVDTTLKLIRIGAETVLFVLLVAVVTGIWTCLWLPPF